MTNRDGSDEIYVMKAGGTEQPNLTNDLVNELLASRVSFNRGVCLLARQQTDSLRGHWTRRPLY